MNEYDLVYAAGFFDGEGSIDISNRKEKNRIRYILQVRVGQSKEVGKQICNWLQLNFDGYIFSRDREKNIEYLWTVTAQKAFKFLSQIYPYLKGKKNQANLAIEFAQEMNKNLGKPWQLEKYSYYETAKQEMHFLNGTKGK